MFVGQWCYMFLQFHGIKRIIVRWLATFLGESSFIQGTFVACMTSKQACGETRASNAFTLLYIYIYAFSRRFYPKRLKVHSGCIFCQYVCSLGIEPTNFCAANAMLYHWATRTLCFIQNFTAFFHHRETHLHITHRLLLLYISLKEGHAYSWRGILFI